MCKRHKWELAAAFENPPPLINSFHRETENILRAAESVLVAWWVRVPLAVIC